MERDESCQIDIELKKNLECRNYKEPISFDEAQNECSVIREPIVYNQEILEQTFGYLNKNWKVMDDISTNSNNFLERILKKIVKKLTGFIIVPVLNSQSTYNAQNVRCIAQLKGLLDELEQYKEKVEQLEKKIIEIENRNECECE